MSACPRRCRFARRREKRRGAFVECVACVASRSPRVRARVRARVRGDRRFQGLGVPCTETNAAHSAASASNALPRDRRIVLDSRGRKEHARFSHASSQTRRTANRLAERSVSRDRPSRPPRLDALEMFRLRSERAQMRTWARSCDGRGGRAPNVSVDETIDRDALVQNK